MKTKLVSLLTMLAVLVGLAMLSSQDVTARESFRNIRLSGTHAPQAIGTEPIMINMVKGVVEGEHMTSGGAFATFYNQPTATLRTVEMTIDSTSPSGHTGKFETSVSWPQYPVNSPDRLRRDCIVRLKAGQSLSQDTTVYGCINIYEGQTLIHSEPYDVVFKP